MTTLEAPVTTDSRLAAIVDDVVEALCGVIRTHGVTVEEYRIATDWLTGAGQQEFQIPLLLDLFLSTTVDEVGASADGGTESNVEGPFYLPDMPMLERPYVLPRRADEPGEVLLFSGSVTSTDGTPLADALVDVWQDNGAGEYSHFHPGVPENNLRGRLLTDADGRFELETILPVPYEVPTDGAVGTLLAALGQVGLPPRPRPREDLPRGRSAADDADLLCRRPVAGGRRRRRRRQTRAGDHGRVEHRGQRGRPPRHLRLRLRAPGHRLTRPAGRSVSSFHLFAATTSANSEPAAPAAGSGDRRLVDLRAAWRALVPDAGRNSTRSTAAAGRRWVALLGCRWPAVDALWARTRQDDRGRADTARRLTGTLTSGNSTEAQPGSPSGTSVVSS